MGSSRLFSGAIPHTLLVCLVVTLSSLPGGHQHNLKLSTISASPAVLPFPQPPSSSPDISPLFPTPGGSKVTPSPMESSLPIIPSSPSPPNPDASNASPEPDTAVSPAASLPQSSARALHPSPSSMVSLLQLLAVPILPHLVAFS